MDLHVLVLAAGFGKRLRPLTDQMPKPLVPLVDASVLAHQVRLAHSVEPTMIHVNAHYLAAQIQNAAPLLGRVRVWEEPKLLGTGGPLHRMYGQGLRGELLVLNGDCYCQVDLSQFVSRARQSGAPCALLGRRFPEVDTLRMDSSGVLRGIAGRFGESNTEQQATFTGISWYGPSAWSDILPHEFDIRDTWKRWVQNQQGPWVDMASEAAVWIDMGSPQGLFQAAMQRLQELTLRNWIDPSVSINASMAQWDQAIVHASVQVGDGAVLRQVVLLPGAVVAPGETVERQIRAKDMQWQL